MGALKNDKWERFCREYIIDLNGTQAAIRAGYAPRSARQQAVRLLSNASITERIAELSQKVENNLEEDAATLRRNLRSMADVRLSDIFDETHKLRPMDELTDGAQLLISGFKYKDGELTEVKILDKLKAMELLGKHHEVSAWEENVNLNDGDDRVERIRRAQERLGKRSGNRAKQS